MPSDGSGEPLPVVTRPGDDFAADWSPDGRSLIFASSEKGTGDLWRSTLSGNGDPVPFVESDQIVTAPSFSVDGRFVAYQTRVSGRDEIYVTRFPGGEGRWLIGRGKNPRWSGNGRELFYESDSSLMAVGFTTTDVFRPGIAEVLFTVQQGDVYEVSGRYYDVSADGQRFLVVRQAAPTETPTITVVQNWYAEFKDRN